MTAAPSTPKVRVALPRGELREALAARLATAGLDVPEYREGARTYRFDVPARPGLEVRVFSDRDIPIQVALGQYDLGVASRAGIDELIARHPRGSLVPLRPLDIGDLTLVLAGPPGADLATIASGCAVRIATEFPLLTERWLNRARVRAYRVLDVWGLPQAWPPEDAEFAVLPETDAHAEGLIPLTTVHTGSAWLIGNREALARRDFGAALGVLLRLPAGRSGGGAVEPAPLDLRPGPRRVPARAPSAIHALSPRGA